MISSKYCAAAMIAVMVSMAAAALTADPSAVVFQSLDETATVTVLNNGAPVAVESVKSHELYVGEHTYGYMIGVHAVDGKLQIKPKILEAGSYMLVVNTNAGEVRVDVYAPLAELPTTYESQAAMLGMTVDELKEQLRLVDTFPRERISIELPPVYYVGQTLTIQLEPSQNTMSWAINGDTITEGVNANTFHYTFKKPGDYLLTYVEHRDGAVVAADTAVTRVLRQPAVETEIKPNTEVILSGPAGYSHYTWNYNESQLGKERVLRYKPLAPGEYLIVCTAEGPAGGGESFQEIRYLVKAR